MLHTVTALTQNSLGQVGWRLRNKVDADTLRANQTYDLLDLVGQRTRCILKEHMRLVEEEYHLRQLHIANLGHLLIYRGKQPHKERRVELGLEHQLVSCQDVHHATAILCLQQIVDVKGRLAEELVATLLGKRQK